MEMRLLGVIDLGLKIIWWDLVVGSCLLAMSEATTPRRAHQHDCLNRSSTRKTPIHMPKWMGKSHEVS